ncbi:MAG TPA: twin-arginine translocation signal domain-containing protein, partial [Gammaproteobacteria bacterium]|nr:twin-arginine translocation signal domain-containing protein [Gammaproteobacteria bacterium]
MSLEKNKKGVEVDAGRRSFVKRSAAVSTAAAVGPWIISSKALA